MEIKIDLPKRQSQGLAESYAEQMTLLKSYFARKNEPDKKAWPDFTKTFAKTLILILKTWLRPKERKPEKNKLCQMKPLACQNLTENLEVDFRCLNKFDTKLFEQKTWADFEERKTWKIATAKNARLYWKRKLC